MVSKRIEAVKRSSFGISGEATESSDISILNEELCPILNENEFGFIGYNEELFFVYGKDQFLSEFAKNFRAGSYSFNLNLKKDKYYVEDTLILKDKNYTAVVDILKPHYFYLEKEGEDRIAILVHPVKRKTCFINNLTGQEEVIDVLNAVDKCKSRLALKGIIKRVDDIMGKEAAKTDAKIAYLV